MTYPEWVMINKEKKLSEVPNKWRVITNGMARNTLLSILDTPSSGLHMWDVKGDVWIQHDKTGWLRLDVSYKPDTTVRRYVIIYYYGNKENYKTFLLFPDSLNSK